MEHSLLSVLWGKLVGFLEEHSIRDILRFLSLTFLGGVLSAVVLDFRETVEMGARLLRYRDFAPLKVFAVFALVFNARRLLDFLRAWFAAPPDTDTIEGIPTAELLDHLFIQKSLKVKEVTAKFSVPQYRVEELVKNLKRVEVLVAGPNNASVLNPEFSRQDVASILRGHHDARDLSTLFRRQGNHLTTRPSAREIEARVAPLLSAAPGFETKALAS